jgi:1-phosphofructokinase family hexose kinase
MILTITPNPALDRILTLPGLTVGSVNRALDVRVMAGGKGINAARAVSALGGQARALVPLGGLTGGRLEELARGERLALEVFDVVYETRTATILLHNGDMTVINEPGERWDARTWRAFVAAVPEPARGVDTICISGSCPPGIDEREVRTLLEQARAACQAVWVDSSGIGLRVAYHMGGLMLKVNAAEIGVLVGQLITTPVIALAAAQQVYAQTGAAVVVTLGEQGAVMVNAEGGFMAIPPSITPVNPIGSGDSFLAAIALRGANAQGLCHGVAAGTANALTSHGGGHFMRASFDDILQRVKLTTM